MGRHHRRFAPQIQTLTTTQLAQVYDALQLHTLCNESPTYATSTLAGLIADAAAPNSTNVSDLPPGTVMVYTDATNGSDVTGDGSAAKPFQSVAAAVRASRAAREAQPSAPAFAVVLRSGTYRFTEAVELTVRA